MELNRRDEALASFDRALEVRPHYADAFCHRGVALTLEGGDPLPDFDLQCSLLSLPRAFGTELATIPSATPYLFVPPSRGEQWDGGLSPRHRPRISLAWSGDPTHSNDRNRSIALDQLLPLLTGIDATFVSVQREIRAGDAATLRNHGDVLRHGGSDIESRPGYLRRYQRRSPCRGDGKTGVDIIALHSRLAVVARSRR